jgi:exodeoxyribonuclease VII large subunit
VAAAAQPCGIRDLYRRVQLAVTRELRGQVWVRGEVRTARPRDGACYLTLAEPARDDTEGEATLDVRCPRAAWGRICARLAERGLRLEPGMVVVLRGELFVRAEGGRLQLRGHELDADALVGQLAARRLAARRALEADGLFDRNRRLPLPLVPLRVGLVASRHSEGYRDFLGVLGNSGYAFDVVERMVPVQGVTAPGAIAEALARLGAAGVDVIVVVRGGGARADLVAFDHETVARALVAAPVPVWTGVGHTGDRSLADEVAHDSFPTPTGCAQALVRRVADFDARLAASARRLHQAAERSVRWAEHELSAAIRVVTTTGSSRCDRLADGVAGAGSHLRRAADAGLRRHGERLHQRAAVVSAGVQRGLAGGRDRLDAAARRARPAGRRGLADQQRALDAQRRTLAAFDPHRQLARGWTITLDGGGRVVRRAGELGDGERITTRFVDGSVDSVVELDGTTRP